jgi:hypothetical protein
MCCKNIAVNVMSSINPRLKMAKLLYRMLWPLGIMSILVMISNFFESPIKQIMQIIALGICVWLLLIFRKIHKLNINMLEEQETKWEIGTPSKNKRKK